MKKHLAFILLIPTFLLPKKIITHENPTQVNIELYNNFFYQPEKKVGSCTHFSEVYKKTPLKGFLIKRISHLGLYENEDELSWIGFKLLIPKNPKNSFEISNKYISRIPKQYLINNKTDEKNDLIEEMTLKLYLNPQKYKLTKDFTFNKQGQITNLEEVWPKTGNKERKFDKKTDKTEQKEEQKNPEEEQEEIKEEQKYYSSPDVNYELNDDENEAGPKYFLAVADDANSQKVFRLIPVPNHKDDSPAYLKNIQKAYSDEEASHNLRVLTCSSWTDCRYSDLKNMSDFDPKSGINSIRQLSRKTWATYFPKDSPSKNLCDEIKHQLVDTFPGFVWSDSLQKKYEILHKMLASSGVLKQIHQSTLPPGSTDPKEDDKADGSRPKSIHNDSIENDMPGGGLNKTVKVGGGILLVAVILVGIGYAIKKRGRQQEREAVKSVKV